MKQRVISGLLPVSVIIAMVSVACAEIAKPKIFNIISYGAVGDGEALDTESMPRVMLARPWPKSLLSTNLIGTFSMVDKYDINLFCQCGAF